MTSNTNGCCFCCCYHTSNCFSCILCSKPSEFDYAQNRRRVLLSSTYCEDHSSKEVEVISRYVEKPNGSLLHTKLFVPKNIPPKAMICYNIGFADHLDYFYHDVGQRYAELGYIVFMHEPIGYGKSDGLFAHMPTSFDVDIVDDAIFIFDWAKLYYGEKYGIPKGKYFLSGTSMGGATSIRIATKEAHKWLGMVVAAPMCAISEDAKPSSCMIWCLSNCLLPCFPKARLVSNNVKELISADKELQALWEQGPLVYNSNLTLNTANSLLTVTDDIHRDMNSVTLPFFIAHGTDDVLTDPSHSQLFYDNARSQEKDIKLYEGRGHLLYQEAPEVYNDSDEWMMHILRNLSSVNANGIVEEKDDDEEDENVGIIVTDKTVDADIYANQGVKVKYEMEEEERRLITDKQQQ